MIETPKLVEYPGQPHAAVIHLTIPRHAIQQEMEPAIKEILSVLNEQQVKPVGPLFAHHLTQSCETFDFQVGFPIKDTIAESDSRVKNGSLPSGTMVHTSHTGPYEELHAAWTAFEEHLKSNQNTLELKNLQKGDTLFEIYTIGPETTSDTSQWRTDMYQTLKNT